MSIFVSIPTLLVISILFRRIKNRQFRVCLAVAYLWVVLAFTLAYENLEGGFSETVVGLAPVLPAYLAARFLLLFMSILPAFLQSTLGALLATLFPFVAFPLGYVISFAVTFLPFSLYHFMRQDRSKAAREDKNRVKT